MNSLEFFITPGNSQAIWDNTDNVIDKFYVHPLKAINSGELIYAGTSLHDIIGEDIADANFTFRLRVMGTQNLKLDMRVRRQDDSNFIALKIDFMSDTIKIVETISGIESTLAQASHDFKFIGRIRYDFEIRMVGRFHYALVNGYNILKASTKSFRTEPGISLYFPEIDDEDAPLLYSIHALYTEPFPDPQDPERPDDLLVQFRESIKQEIENPSVRNWASFVRAVKFYKQRNVGLSDREWEELGYPIQRPSAEEWFGNEP